MRYLFVYEHLDRGGIETLIVRMGNWLVNNDHEVLLYVERSGSMADLLDTRIELLIPDKKFSFILNPKKIAEKINDKQINCVYTFGPKSCLVGGIIYSNLSNKKNINFFSGIYHSREFNTARGITLRGITFLNYFKKYLKTGTHVFMSKETKEGIEHTAKTKFDEALIWPLAINLPEKSFTGKPEKLKIVSIGRYVAFKSYNLYMFDVVKHLINKGLDVTWEVYGHGGLQEKMVSLAQQKEYEGRIKVFGGIQYDKIPEALKDACVFIGMGTALLEAGSYGVPCIPAIAYTETAHSYGYLYDIPYYTCGDNLGYDPEISVESLIEELYSYDTTAFDEHRFKTKNYVAEYGMDALMSKFIKFTAQEDTREKVNNYSLLSSYCYILISYYSSLRYMLDIKNRWGNFKKLFIRKNSALSSSHKL